MSMQSLMSFITDLIQSPDKFENFDDMIKQSLNVFEEFSTALKEASPEERAAIAESLEGLQGELNSQLENISKESGLSLDELQNMMADAKNFSAEELSSLDQFKKELDKKTMQFSGEEAPKRKRRKKSGKKKWISA